VLLCDIGNTTYTFFDGTKLTKYNIKEFDPKSIEEKIFYINVNPTLSSFLSSLPNWIDLSGYIDKTKYYDTMGIDRIFGCEAIENGVIVDAGSAITVDVVQENGFQGGFIYPGKDAFATSFASISKALDYEFDFTLDLKKLPKNTSQALTYGFLSGLIKEIESYNLPIYLTGGDAKILQPFFQNAIYEPLLLFKGMAKIIDENNLLFTKN